MHVEVQRRAEALDDGHGTTAAVGHATTTGIAAEPAEHCAHVDGHDRPTEFVIPRQHVPNARRQTQDPWPDRHWRKDVIDRRRRRWPRRQEAQAACLTGHPCRVNELPNDAAFPIAEMWIVHAVAR